jgi:hypothetical protein
MLVGAVACYLLAVVSDLVEVGIGFVGVCYFVEVGMFGLE